MASSARVRLCYAYAVITELGLTRFPRSIAGTTPGLPGGARDNLSFEGLALLPDGRLLASLEAPLVQDGPVSRAD